MNKMSLDYVISEYNGNKEKFIKNNSGSGYKRGGGHALLMTSSEVESR